jgi:chromosome segregation ATPase
MSEFTDLGTYIMKLFDPLIAESKTQMNEFEKNFLRELPRKVGSRSSVSISRIEDFVRQIAEELTRINNELLHQYSVSIAKKARSASKTQLQGVEGLKEQISKKDREIEGLLAQTQSYEQRVKTLEQEKETILSQLSSLNNTINELQQRLVQVEEGYQHQISQLNTEWKTKFKKNQEEWDSYMKLKLAEQEVQSTKKVVDQKQDTE